MATLEHVEKLRERANVTYEEAKEALNACGDDLLDAMIYLENKGKVNPPAAGGSYSSKDAPQDAPPPAPEYKVEEKAGESLGDIVRRFFRFCGTLLQKGNTNSFEVWRGGSCSFSMPVTVLVVLMLFFWITVPIAIVGLFFGYRYRFSGPNFQGSSTVVNKAMDGAAHAAEVLKKEIQPKDPQNKDSTSDPE